MYIFMIVLHVVVCLVLIAVVLLQAGRGGGLSEMIGTGQPQSLFGTQTNQFMTRATEICAVIFVLTSLCLGIMSTQRGKSLVERRMAIQNLTNLAKTARPAAEGPVTKDPLEVNAAQVPPPTTVADKQVLDAKAADPAAPAAVPAGETTPVSASAEKK